MKEPKRRDMHNGPRQKEVKKYPLNAEHMHDSMMPPSKSAIQSLKERYENEDKEPDANDG